MEVIVFNNFDGSCAVIIPAPKCDLSIEEIAQKDVPEGLEYRILDKLPSDKDYRNAWVLNLETDAVEFDLEKAREIHMDKIREVRDAKLKILDIETLKGIDVQAEKQVLRDLPQTIDLSVAQTIEELKAIMPSELNG